MTPDRMRASEIAGLCAFGFAVRVAVALLTPVPAEDAANYLWMAERFAAGDAASAVSEVFPPGLPLLVAPIVALGVDPFRGGQFVLAVVAALGLWPCVRIAEHAEPRTARATGWLLALVPLAVRFVGQVYTEPLFATLAAWALLFALRGRHWFSGIAAAAAFWTRPEALALPAANLVLGRTRGAVALVPLALGVLLLAAWRAGAGQPFELLPKLAFNAARGDAGLGLDGVAWRTIAGNLLAFPGAWLEAFWGAGLLAIAGAWASRRGRDARAFAAVFAVAALAIVAFLVRRRFLVAWLPVLALFVPVALAGLRERTRYVAQIVVVLTSIFGCLRLEPHDRHAERVLGEWLRSMLKTGESVAGDMTRVIWFSGGRPLSPRHFSPDELIEAARRPGVRFVVLAGRRDGRTAIAESLAPEFTPTGLPSRERRAAELRGMIVLERR